MVEAEKGDAGGGGGGGGRWEDMTGGGRRGEKDRVAAIVLAVVLRLQVLLPREFSPLGGYANYMSGACKMD